MRRRRLLVALLPLLGALVLVATGVSRTSAAFTNTTSNDSNTVSSKRIFPASHTTTGWDLKDASAGGAATDKSDELYAASDGLTQQSANKFPTVFTAADYLDFFFSAPWPAGLSASSATLHITSAAGTAGDNLCYDVDVRSTSGNSSLGTLNNGGSHWCNSTTTQVQKDIDISSLVTTTDQLNDLDVRVNAWANPTEKVTLDRVWVTATDAYGTSYTSYVTRWNDQSNGTAAQQPWALSVANDASGAAPTYTDLTNWPTTAVATKYLQVTFPPNLVPSGATINSVTFNHSWHSATAGATTCYFMTVTGGTYNQTFPAAGNFSPCATTNTTFVTRNDSLSPVPTAAQLNAGLVVKLSYQATAGKTVDDLATLTVNWHLD